ncbi:MAG: universal stress protein [Microscillaceae bacterium]|jgi:nucleotide-binding universal stress UspA family protein|nr:universal stress protein [Microscillaceae bacterium]
MKKLLVPIDFSDCSLNALRVAYQLAQKAQAQLQALHIVEPVYSYVGAADGMYLSAEVEQKYLESLVAAAEEKMKEIAQNPDFGGVELDTQVKIGNMFNLIKKEIETQSIDLIVMGTQGVSGIDEILVGSNTEKIVRMSGCPVLTVRENAQVQDFKKIVLATDLYSENRAIIEQIQALQQLLEAHLYLVYVNEPGDFQAQRGIEERKAEFVRFFGLQNYSFQLYCDKSIEAGILHYAEDIEADLIVMVTHQRNGISHFVAGSIAEDIVNHSPRPVLTYGLKTKALS